MRWPEGPSHLALNPPYFLFVFVVSFFFLFGGFVLFCFLFVVLFLERENPVLSLQKDFCLFLSVSLRFSLVFFYSPFHSLSLYLSLVLFFLPSLFLLSLLLPCFCLFVSLLLFHEKNNIRIIYLKIYFHQSFLF